MTSGDQVALKDKFPGFTDLLRQGLGDLLAPGAESLTEMLAADGVVEFPFAPSGLIRSLTGRTELQAHLESLGDALELTSFHDLRVHRTADPEVVILEYQAEGRSAETDAPYNQTYISVFTLRDGYIQHFRDYWNPLVVLGAVGDPEAFRAPKNSQAA